MGSDECGEQEAQKSGPSLLVCVRVVSIKAVKESSIL